MRKSNLFLPLLAGFAIATPAYAQDAGVKVRAELRAGYDEVRADFTVQNSVFSDDFGFGDAMAGVEAGVDLQISSSVLVGAYGGVDVSKVDKCTENPFSLRTASRRDRLCADAGLNFYAGARAGIPIGDSGVVYVKGGYSRGTFEGSYVATVVAAGQRTGQVFSGEDTVGGYHIGGGFELNLNSSTYIKAEYVQHNYDDAFTELLNLDLTDPNPLRRTDRFAPKRHQLVFGVGFRFGGSTR